MALCTKQNVKDYLKMEGAGDDDLIEKIFIPAAQGFIESYCRRSFEDILQIIAQEVIEYLHGGTDRFFLKNYPISPTPALKLYEDSDREFGETTKVDPEDYFVDYESGIIFVDYFLEKGWGAIKVVYTTLANEGTEEDAQLTGDAAVARQACIEIVARKLRTGTKGDIGVVSRGLPGGTSVTFSEADLLPETKIALDSISRPL